MPFVRRRGNQIAILQGFRDAETQKVKQHLLHSIRTRAEADAIVARDPEAEGLFGEFRRLMECSYPSLQFDWERIRAEIGELRAELPESTATPAPGDRLSRATVEFVRALVEEVPDEGCLARLEVVSDLLRWAVDEREPDPFGWRAAFGAVTAPGALEVYSVAMRLRGEDAAAEQALRLMNDCYPDAPQSYLSLGELCIQQGQTTRAMEYLEQARRVTLGRLPPGLPRGQYLATHRARPWIEATTALAECHASRGDYDAALVLCDEARGHGEDRTAGVRAAIHLCREEWDEARCAAIDALQLDDRWSLVVALACAEGDEPIEALAWFTYSLLHEQRCDRLRRLIAPYLHEHAETLERLEAYEMRPEIAEARQRAARLVEQAPSTGEELRGLRSLESARAIATRILEPTRRLAQPITPIPRASIGFTPDGWPTEHAWSTPTSEFVQHTAGVEFVAMWATFDESFQHAWAHAVGQPSRAYVARWPRQMATLVLKGRQADARRLASRIGPWPRFTLRGDGELELECGDGPSIRVTVPDDLRGDPRILVAVQGGGTKQKQGRASLSDAVFLTPALRRTPRDELGFTHYEIEVRLADVAPPVWRTLLIQADSTFLDLHDAIQKACGWDDAHLFLFHGSAGWSETIADCPYEPEGEAPLAPDVELAAHFEHHDSCTYIYDLGDEWEHQIRVLARRTLAEDDQRRILGGARAFPPEDAGGLPGYDECCRVAYGAMLLDSDDREHLADRREWLGDWRPDSFNLFEAAERLLDRQHSWRLP